jgi:hypothetical protein
MQNPVNGTLASFAPSSTPVVVIDDNPNLGDPDYTDFRDDVMVMALVDNTGPDISKGDTFFASPHDLTGDLVAYRP